MATYAMAKTRSDRVMNLQYLAVLENTGQVERDLGKLVPDWTQPSAPLQVSKVLMRWLVAPTEDWNLGSDLVRELELNHLGLQPQL